MEIPGCEVKGSFDVQRFYDVLAKILSNREHCEITVTVIKEPKEDMLRNFSQIWRSIA